MRAPRTQQRLARAAAMSPLSPLFTALAASSAGGDRMHGLDFREGLF